MRGRLYESFHFARHHRLHSSFDYGLKAKERRTETGVEDVYVLPMALVVLHINPWWLVPSRREAHRMIYRAIEQHDMELLEKLLSKETKGMVYTLLSNPSHPTIPQTTKRTNETHPVEGAI